MRIRQKLAILTIFLGGAWACGTDAMVRGQDQDPTPPPEPKPAPRPRQAPLGMLDARGAKALVRGYYAAIQAGEYEKAYRLWSGEGEASGKSLEEFRKGFADTKSVEVTIGKPSEIEGAAGSRYITIPVEIHAVTQSGAPQHFNGEYVLRRSVVDGATEEQRAWRIYSAKVREVAPE